MEITQSQTPRTDELARRLADRPENRVYESWDGFRERRYAEMTRHAMRLERELARQEVAS